jgi:peptide/nickel transport system permease protein
MPSRPGAREPGFWREAWTHLRHDPSALLGLGIVLMLLVVAVFAPILAPHPPEIQFREGLTDIGQPVGPSAAFPLGTDELGRDELSRLIYGTRVSLLVGIAGNAIAAIFATLFGGLAGMLGGAWQTAIMRSVDLVLSFPVLLLAITLLVIASPGILTVTGIVALAFGAYLSRVVFSLVVSLRQREFVTAAETSGMGRGAILVRHILPHVMPALLVFSTLNVAAAIQLEAILSYVGIGVRAPTASWGNMIATAQDYLTSSPFLILGPSVAIMLALLGFGLLGDGLRDAVDPTLDGARRLASVR